MRPIGSPTALERRRRKALALLKRGLSLAEVAVRLATTRTSVFRWSRAHRDGGEMALARKPIPGRPRKLDNEECQRLLGLLVEGAVAYGFPTDFWTLKRIARVIREEFGVEYNACHLWRVLQRLGWSCQVPERRAIQRNEKEIEHWKRDTWPAIKKKGQRTWGPRRIR